MIYNFLDLTKFPEPKPKADASLKDHLLYLKKYIFDQPYPNGENRGVHDIKHAIRALLHTNGILTILQHLNIGEEFTALLNDELFYKAILIAIYLHDSGREGDGSDEWELDSGMTVYNYLTQVIGCSKTKAKICAEAVANKDYKRNNKFFILVENAAGEITWKEIPCSQAKCKAEFQKTLTVALPIQYGDCIDIHRTLKNETFDTDFLDLYTLYAKELEQLLPLLLIEERRLLELMGDGPTTNNPELQAYFQRDEFLERTSFIIAHHCPTLARFCLSGPLALENSLRISSHLKSTNLFQECMDKGQLLFRGIVAGPAYYALTHGEAKQTLAEIEIGKNLSLEKNPNRSTSLLGHGGTAFSSVGGIICNPTIDQITSISGSDAGTGFQTKMNVESLTQFEKQRRWEKLQRDIRFGKGVGYVSEIEITIDHFDAIGFTLDPTVHEDFSKRKSPVHPKTAILKAIYLHQEYNKQNRTTSLPFYEFSNLQHFCIEIFYTEEIIIQLWKDACRYWISRELEECRHYDINLWNLSVEELKIYITFDRKKMQLLTGAGKIIHQAPDLNYSSELKAKVNAAVSATRSEIFQEHHNPKKIEETEASLAQKPDQDFHKTTFWNPSEKIYRLILQLRTFNLLEKHKERVLRLLHQYFSLIQEFEKSDIFYLFTFRSYLLTALRLFKLAMAMSSNNNPVLKYLISNVIPLYTKQIEQNVNFPFSQKNHILDLLGLIAECDDSKTLTDIYNRYYLFMAGTSSQAPREIRECVLFYDFCKRTKQLTPENLVVYKKMLASISFNEAHDSDLTGCVGPSFCGFQIEYDSIFQAYIDRGFIDLAKEKLTELLRAGHKNIQIKPLNSLLSYCHNRKVSFNLDDLLITILQVAPLTTKWTNGIGIEKIPLLVSHFLRFLVNTENMCNQQYSENQLLSIRMKLKEIISIHSLEQWDIDEIEKCLDINKKKDYLGPHLTAQLKKLQSDLQPVTKIPDNYILTSTSLFTRVSTRSSLNQPTNIPSITVDIIETETVSHFVP